jgi:type II secretory pathway component PulF
MSFYKISYIDSAGEEQSFSVEAKDEGSAIDLAPIAEHLITNVSIDIFQYVSFFRNRKGKIKLRKQALYLQSVASIVDSGIAFRKAFEDIFLDNNEFKYDAIIFSKCETLSDFASTINFHPSVISIASLADKTGDVVGSLEMASDFCSSLARVEEEFMASLLKSSVYIILALLFFIGAPFIQGSMLYEMVYVDKSPLPLNLASHLLIESADFYRNYGIFIILLFFGMFINRARIFEKVKHLMFFRLIHKLICVNRSFLFVSVYKMMLFSGMTPIAIVRQMYDQAKGRDRGIYKKMIDRLAQGDDIGSTIDLSEWSNEVYYALNKSDQKTEAALSKTFDASKESIKANQLDVGHEIGKLCILMGMLSMSFVIVIVFLGFLVPIYSQRINL